MICHDELVQQLNEEIILLKGMVEAITNNPIVAFVVCRLDHTVVYVNDTFETVFGWTREEMLERKLPIVPNSEETDFMQTLNTNQWQIPTYEAKKQRKNGSVFIASESVVPIRVGSEISAYACIIRDITQRKIEERKLKESEQRYKSLFQHNPDGVFSLDMEGRFTSVNPAMENITGYSPDEMLYRSVGEVIHVLRVEEVRIYFEEAKRGATQNFDSVILHKNGERIELHVTMLPILIDHEVTGVYCIAKDITERKKNEALIHYMAYHDVLTDLPNRRMFQERAVEALGQAATSGEKLAFFVVDMDGFKAINDRHGHAAGDHVLHVTAARLKEWLEPGNIVARMGGDEFTILIHEADDVQRLEQLAALLLAKLNEPITYKETSLQVSPSIGISRFPDHGQTIDTLLNQADTAMYKAKMSGKNSYVVSPGSN
ncbi:diguanylate cyclase domain-containing protein [Paenibacillus thalictri]|nr:diguanylate cyclase [Paenibacillus thalictri]